MGYNTPIPQQQVRGPDLTRLRGAEGLITVDTSRHVVVVMDGETYGGHPQVPEYRQIKAGTPNVKISGGDSADLSKDVTIAVLPGTTPTGIKFVENPPSQPKGKYLAISYLDRHGQDAVYYVDASLVVDLYTAGTGIKITGNEVSVDIASLVSTDAGNQLGVGSDGKLVLKGFVSTDAGNILSEGSDGGVYFPANLGTLEEEA